MSQIVTRKGHVGEEKDKRQTDSPVKEMKKKIAANAEKEKQAAEKITEKSEKSVHHEKEKKHEKASEKIDKPDKVVEKTDKKDKLDKSIDKKDKLDKSVDKKDKLDKSVDKKDKLDKSLDKKDKAEKSVDKKEAEKKEHAVEKEKTTEKRVVEDKKAVEEKKEDKSNKDKDVKAETDEKSKKPEPKAKENGAKVNGEQNGDTSKLLKLKDDVPASDRKLRSADSPKPGNASDSSDKVLIPVVVLDDINEAEKETSNADDKMEREIEVVVEVENEDEGRVKADTNFSKSRVKVSPYRRSTRLADNTNTSLLANYTGNNTTMEMDITETSSFISEEPSPDSPYLSGLRSIRGRRSYKPLREMALRNIGGARGARAPATGATSAEHPTRPTGTVVGRKRKPSHEEVVELASEAEEAVRSKRARLLERLAKPFRMASTPLPARRAAEIVGINTDLPLSAPVASADTFDPEAIKPPGATVAAPPTPSPAVAERDSKRCVVM
ncbi:titin homolog isoform X4 [Pararge aegeria]|uniref:titin homolog isoform X4 n=1 Tax=Pararge aegeria TaxID=116150 RepID=UPI0019D2C7D3|nr:titin homolog isoform X4 [Pararge aegeria]